MKAAERKVRSAVERAALSVAERDAVIADTYHAGGFTLRQLATVAGLSFQRVQQIVVAQNRQRQHTDA